MKMLLTLVCGLSVGISACGGGGGGGGGGGSGTAGGGNSTTTTTINGVAADGLLLNAIVTFYPVANGAVGTTALGTTRTDAATGTFSVTVSASGPIVATLTVDSATQMLDEISGQVVAAPTGLTLHTVLDGAANAEPVSITPLTELAYSISAGSSGGLTVANIDSATSAVGNTFLAGASIVYTSPISLSSYRSATVTEQAQAKLLAALAVAASQGTATGASTSTCAGLYPTNMPCVIAGLSGLLTVNSSGAATLGSNASYLQAAYSAIDSGVVTLNGGQTSAALGINAPTAAQTAFNTAVAKQLPLPGYSESANPLQNTKDLVANIRTNILDQQSTQTFGFSATLSALTKDLNANVNPVVGSLSHVIAGAYRSAFWLAAGTVQYSGTQGSSCVFDPDSDGLPNNVVACTYGNRQTGTILLTVTRTTPTTYQLTTQPAVQQPDGSPGYQFSPDPSQSPLVATLTLTLTGPQSGSLSGPFYVDANGGHVTASLSAAESADWNATTLTGSISFSGTLSSGGGDVSLVHATLGSDTVFKIQNAASATSANLLQPGIPPISFSGVADLTEYNTGSFNYAGRVSISPPVFDASGTVGIPSEIDANVSISQVTNSALTPLFDGSLSLVTMGAASFDVTQPVTAINSLTLQANASGTLALPGGRILTVTASANATELNPTPDRPDSFTASYSYSTPQGTARLNASGTYDATNGLSGTITNNAGVNIAVTYPIEGPLSGSVTANGVSTATISGAFIEYSDRSSESIF